MLTVVLAVAVVGIALLAAAVLTDNTIVAVIVIVVALLGLFLLGREWLRERRPPNAPQDGEHSGDAAEPHHAADERLQADEFEPDVPYEESGDSTE